MNAGTVRLPLATLLLTLTLPCDRLWAQTDPFVGNWRWVPERSRVIFRGAVPKDIKYRFVVENGKLREESEIILPDGRSVPAVYIHQYDGQEHTWESTWCEGISQQLSPDQGQSRGIKRRCQAATLTVTLRLSETPA